MATPKWEASQKFKGVRWYKHESRKYGVRYDRCFDIRYSGSGQRFASTLGWESAGWSEEKAYLKRDEYLENLKKGEKPYTYKQELELLKLKNELDSQIELQEAESKHNEGITFGEVFAAYLIWAKNNKKHWKDDEQRYNSHLKGSLHTVLFNEVNSYLLEQIKATLLRKLSPASTKHCLVIVRQVYNRAIEGAIGVNEKHFVWHGVNPIAGVKLRNLVGDNSKQRTLDTFDSKRGEQGSDERRLMASLEERSFVTYGLAMTSLYGGLRFAEAANLKWMHIDLKSGHINCLEGKGGLDRKILIPIHKKLYRALELQFEKQNPKQIDLVWPGRGNIPFKSVSETFPRVVKKLGLNEGITDRRMTLDFHSLRHTFATRLGNAGTPITILRDLLGHRDFTMVSRYAKSSQSVAEEAIARLG
ncbi:Phage integrase family protein [Maridesulfovibrio ferrireducens]|uniref:Phage integrase family protein n=1 Tax=Maridesulfovibrio ferrireducens TaxID=246191 RepID=A0A1G9ASA8_9BACT|nr:site-specific integrase [Maridesulfovibrio ferrireducens]SDK30206.1 Phage integrase family protein [Maridesulfovibrio ferrireducens]